MEVRPNDAISRSSGATAEIIGHLRCAERAAGSSRPGPRRGGTPAARASSVRLDQLLEAPLPESTGMLSRMCDRDSSPLAWVEFSAHCWFCGEDRTLASWTATGTTPGSEPALTLAGRPAPGLVQAALDQAELRAPVTTGLGVAEGLRGTLAAHRRGAGVVADGHRLRSERGRDADLGGGDGTRSQNLLDHDSPFAYSTPRVGAPCPTRGRAFGSLHSPERQDVTDTRTRARQETRSSA